jgi:molybdopterin/thiamine biosynthesis adenylyltransferase
MSAELMNLSPDLRRLRDEGYSVETRSNFILVHDVPYVTSNKTISFGSLVSTLTLASPERTAQPENHTCYFVGEYPCMHDGKEIQGIKNRSKSETLADGISVNHLFSARPDTPYTDYYEKFTTYISIISREAQVLNPEITAKIFKPIETTNKHSVFNYMDTNSSRAKIDAVNDKIRGLKIAIIGLGGTGSYVLDVVAKSPVLEIHLFDGDLFLQHNAFRGPGAATIDDLKKGLTKVAYYSKRYQEIHKGIFPHPIYITEENVHELGEFHFVFVCIDRPTIKSFLFPKLVELKIPFIDTGIDVERGENGLLAMVRVTSCDQAKSSHLPSRVSFTDTERGNEYRDNIQIAELNMINAAMAILRWKRMFGFYPDLEQEYHSLYSVNSSQLANHDNVT